MEKEEIIKLPRFLTDKKTEDGGITGSTLKIIAIVTMLIDHIAASVLDGYLNSVGYQFHNIKYIFTLLQQPSFLNTVYLIDLLMRLIGRLSFPLFCFLLSEGYMHTHSRFKYALRLLVFSLISEIPFDLALGSQAGILNFTNQNVFFTLFIGLLTIWGMEHFQKIIPLPVLIFFAGILGAEFLNTDYGGIGVLTILVIHALRTKSNAFSMFAGCLVQTVCYPIEFTSMVNFLFVRQYNGKRGIRIKYAFYVFYPVHLFILYLIKQAVIS